MIYIQNLKKYKITEFKIVTKIRLFIESEI